MNFSHSSRGGSAGFGGFGFDPDQIFGPQGILNQVFGAGQGQGGWAQGGHGGPAGPGRAGGPGRRGPFGGDVPFGPDGPFGGGGRGRGHGGGHRARRGDVRNAVLHLLRAEPMNGYQLMQEIEKGSGGSWRPSSGAIYPALALLEDEGLISQVELEGRKAYRLTEAGEQAAQDLPAQAWIVDAEPEPEEERRPFAGPGRGEQGRRERGAQLWKALGTVAMATQAVGQAGDQALSREAADLLDRTRRDLYRLLAEAEYARDEEAGDQAQDDGEGEHARDGSGDHPDDEITDAEIVED